MAFVPSLLPRFNFTPFASSTPPPPAVQQNEETMTVQPAAADQDRSPPSFDTPLPRKRSKVSRACDECRRKKIRCDATLESGPEQCSSCKRVGEKCSFSRIPMKRGPSKGYIKELEDRLNSLEHSISSADGPATGRRNSALADIRTTEPSSMNGHKGSVSSSGSNNYPADSPNSQYSSYAYAYQNSPRTALPDAPRPRTDSIHSLPPPTQNAQLPLSVGSPTLNPARKRAFSSTVEYNHEMKVIPKATEPRAERLPSIDSFRSSSNTAQLPPLNPPASVVDEPAPPYMAPPNGPNHYWKPPYESVKVDSPRTPQLQQPPSLNRSLHRHSIGTGMMGYDPVTSAASSDAHYRSDTSFPFTWDEDTVDAYYAHIHPTFPILAQSRQRFRSRLVAASPPLRNACVHALYALIRGMVSPQRGEQDLQRAVYHLTEVQKEIVRIPLSSSLLIIQTLVLLSLEADNHGLASLEGGPRSSSQWLGSAIGMAHSLHLQNSVVGSDDADLDSDARLGRRIYLVLCMLDRWTAASLSLPLQIPERMLSLVPDDHVTLTTTPYHLVRLSAVLGHVVDSCVFEDDIRPGTRHHYVAAALRGELERVRETIEEIWNSKSDLEVVYWHIKLVTLRLLHAPDPQILLGPATRLAGFLVQKMQMAQTAATMSPSNPTSSSAPWTTPLVHHFLALAVNTLLELSDVHETRDEAWRSLNLIADVLPYAPDPAKWEACVRRAIESRKCSASTAVNASSSGLERLAAIAVGESSGAGGSKMVTETVKLRKFGYLGILLHNEL